MDFHVPNELLIKINHIFKLIENCIEAIDHGKCEVMSVMDLRDIESVERLTKIMLHYPFLWISIILLFKIRHDTVLQSSGYLKTIYR